MPNHVTNVITVAGDESLISKMREAVKNDEFGLGTIDFNKVIPMPGNIYRGDLGMEERRKYGNNNWYDWGCSNWGTKWNAYGYVKGEIFCDSNEIQALTAWAAPHPVIRKLSETYPKLTFTHEWVNEDYGSDCGRKVYAGGEVTEEYYPETNDEILDFVCRIWGVSKEDLE